MGRLEALPARSPHQVVVHGGHTCEEGRRVLAQRVQDLIGLEPVHDPGRRADRGDTEHARDVGQAVEQRKGPHHPVLGVQPRHGCVAGGHRPQAVALRGQDAFGPARGPRGVEHPREVVESQVVPGPDSRFGTCEGLEAQRPFGRVAGDDDPHVTPVRQDPSELGGVGGVGDDDACVAVLEQIREFGVGGTGIERRADGTRSDDRQVALDDFDAVAEVDRHAVARLQPHLHEVTGDVTRAALQLGVGHAPAGVPEGDLVPEPVGVRLQEFRQRPYQFGTQHLTTPSVGEAPRTGRYPLPPTEVGESPLSLGRAHPAPYPYRPPRASLTPRGSGPHDTPSRAGRTGAVRPVAVPGHRGPSWVGRPAPYGRCRSGPCPLWCYDKTATICPVRLQPLPASCQITPPSRTRTCGSGATGHPGRTRRGHRSGFYTVVSGFGSGPPASSCSRRMSACPQWWASSRRTCRYTQRSVRGPAR